MSGPWPRVGLRQKALPLAQNEATFTHMRPFFIPLIILFTAQPSETAELKTTEKGVAISAGSLGEFELTYPTYVDEKHATVHKLVEARAVGGAASLKYEGGSTIAVAVSTAGEVTLTFAETPADVKGISVDLLIDIGFNKGGSWKIGDKTGTFPREKSTPPQFFSGNATRTTITGAQGLSLHLNSPQYGFVQLTDNREWSWPIYAWKCFVPFNRDQPRLTFSITSDAAAAGKKLVDSLGQSTLETWPSKVASVDELLADKSSEEKYYASLQAPERDAFGGLPGSGTQFQLNKTGFFHIEQKDGKSWLVDPAGNIFFHTGVCGFQPSDDFTYISGREEIYEWLPKAASEFTSAFREGDPSAFSFYVANTIRKFSRAHDPDVFAKRMIDRVRKFGFNSMGAFSAVPPKAAAEASFPYVLSLELNEWQGIPRLPGAWEVFDPFDEKVRQLVANQLAKTLPARANDPLLIGYFMINEPRYDELPKVIPSLTGGQACKKRFVQFLRERYATVALFNTAWNSHAAGFEELINQGMAVTTDIAMADIKAFTGVFLETLFDLVSVNYRKHDTHHLLLGTRLQPVTINDEQLCRISGKYFDVMSFNYYTFALDKALLQRVHEWTGGKPMMLSEFFWSSPRDSGLTGGREVLSQQERGLMYRNYVEQSASLGFIIGIEWFTLIDQATTGRWFSKYNGESANTGLFSVTDRPWKPMLEEMVKTNYGIYDVLLGKRPPFAWAQAEKRGGK
jgi:hypothetical protein